MLPRVGKRGWGVSVEFGVRHGPVTLAGVGQSRDGRYRLVASEGQVVPGPHLAIGDATSRVGFGRNPGGWTGEWSGTGVGHHWALATGHLFPDLRALSELLDVALVTVG